ncbi:MAG: anaerobic ribonucleoside-triphosphate reductase [Methanobacterium paludis]|nr:anaerobic ribonucleoside-triphosphate reductase [Methanobacterium paludis]
MDKLNLSKKSIWSNQTVGSTIEQMDKLLLTGNKSNANMRKNPEMIHKYTADQSTRKYALLRMLPADEADKHVNCDIHIHDLEYYYDRPINCMQHDLRFFIENGLMVDGDGLSTSSANPAKNLFTLVNHLGQILGAGQVNMSGGQSIPFINTFLAPYSYHRTDAELKQALQMLIFNINMSYVSRGGQNVFSSFNIDLEMPEFLKKEVIAYGNHDFPLGTWNVTYGTLQDEAKRVAHMIIEVMKEGDGNGKPHLFPNIIFQINDKVNLDEWDDLFELSSKFSLPYFNKSIDGDYGLAMGCRTKLAIDWTGDYNKDLLRTGNLAYISLNLPKYALQATGKDDRTFYDILDENLEVATRILIKRRKHAEDCLNKYNYLKFLTQKDKDGEPYYKIENSTLSFGIVGLYETVKILSNGMSSIYRDMSEYILNYINKKAKELTKSTGYRWSVIGSPAESTAGRFAIANKRQFGDRACVNGVTGAYYYTNSTQMPVDSDILLTEKIKYETQFHKLTKGGHILNIFMGELYADPLALKSLTQKIYVNTDVGFWTYSTIYSMCKHCHTQFKGVQDKCEGCGSEDIEIYDRITGYEQKVSGWNNSKQAEFYDRFRY